ncbi:MAG: MarR family transcriptional regulator, partial [Lachnospiraceae bacterium]|nr:MarR family transcriptional regulator [Lachnospiraceae bacterium]
MDTMTNDTSIMALFEIFFSCQKVLLNSLDYREIKFSRHQIYTLLALGSRESMTMGRVAESLAASREQATRVVASLVEEGYVERSPL